MAAKIIRNKKYTSIKNSIDEVIDPATSDKQDSIITALTAPTNLEGKGIISIGTTAVEITFTGTPRAIIILANTSNTGTIYIGKSNVTSAGANAFSFLEAGESIEIDYNDSTNALYAVSDIASQGIIAGCLL